MDFSQFCSCGPSGRAALRQRIEGCAARGRSYEFAGCDLPEGCSPPRAQVGFWRDAAGYGLYFRPAVRYQGTYPPLADFFGRGAVRRFPTFSALMDCLQGLDSAALPVESESRRLFCQLKAQLRSSVFGQEQAVEATAFKLLGHICKRRPLRPLSLIFYGPTGVGKSELGKAIVPALNRCCGAERYRLVWTELNTFTQAHSVCRLTGAPPGYVGYDDPPILEAVRRCPHTVFMFDELDKAHPEVLKVFMSILDEGRCAARREDGDGGRELDFRRCIFLFTTNADLSRRPALGFAPPAQGQERGTATAPPEPSGLAQRLFQADESARLALIRSGVLREIAGRFSGLIGFQALGEEVREEITAKQIAALGREYGLNIVRVSSAVARGFTPEGALSVRSTLGVLEGALTPLFLAHIDLAEVPLCLDGTPEKMVLRAAQDISAASQRSTRVASPVSIFHR